MSYKRASLSVQWGINDLFFLYRMFNRQKSEKMQNRSKKMVMIDEYDSKRIKNNLLQNMAILIS